MEHPIIEVHDEIPTAEQALAEFITVPGFQEVMGCMLRFINSMIQGRLFLQTQSHHRLGKEEPKPLPLMRLGTLLLFIRPQGYYLRI